MRFKILIPRIEYEWDESKKEKNRILKDNLVGTKEVLVFVLVLTLRHIFVIKIISSCIIRNSLVLFFKVST